MKEQIWSLGGSGIPMTFVDLCYQPLTWTNVVSMETGLRIGLQRGWVVDGVADTSWITALDQSMEFRHLEPWIRTQRQGGEMIWNSIGLYFREVWYRGKTTIQRAETDSRRIGS